MRHKDQELEASLSYIANSRQGHTARHCVQNQCFSDPHCTSALSLKPPTFQNLPALPSCLELKIYSIALVLSSINIQKLVLHCLRDNLRKSSTQQSAQSSHQRGQSPGRTQLVSQGAYTFLYLSYLPFSGRQGVCPVTGELCSAPIHSVS